jgi:hypothetical protein
MKVDRILFHAQFQIARLGWAGALGALLLLAALVADLWINTPLQENLATRQGEVARQALLPPASERAQRPMVVPRERVETALPRLFAAARHHGLRLDEGRYAETSNPGGTAAEAGRRLRIDLPVNGRYPALRAFLAEVLDANPALLLESLELARDEIGETELEARLHFVLNLETTR